MAQDLQLVDFESEADGAIDKFFSERGVVRDLLEISEKKLIIKELALANKKSEIVPKLNALREQAGLPVLSKDFDIFYYAREYAPLIEDISLHYAKNLAKKYRFAGRVTRIAKLNDVAESVFDRITTRNSLESLPPKQESVHNDNIKLFAQLLNAIDEQMGKLKQTVVDVNVKHSDATLQDPAAVKTLVEDIFKRYSKQLPASVDANFKEVTEFEKCTFAEEWTNKTYCQYFGEQCKVQTEELTSCPHFCNKILLNNREYLTKRYVNDNLSVRQIAEIAGCKEVDERVIDAVRGKLKDAGIYRNPAGTTE